MYCTVGVRTYQVCTDAQMLTDGILILRWESCVHVLIFPLTTNLLHGVGRNFSKDLFSSIMLLRGWGKKKQKAF